MSRREALFNSEEPSLDEGRWDEVSGRVPKRMLDNRLAVRENGVSSAVLTIGDEVFEVGSDVRRLDLPSLPDCTRVSNSARDEDNLGENRAGDRDFSN